jgi:hypothetical protein
METGCIYAIEQFHTLYGLFDLIPHASKMGGWYQKTTSRQWSLNSRPARDTLIDRALLGRVATSLYSIAPQHRCRMLNVGKVHSLLIIQLSESAKLSR